MLWMLSEYIVFFSPFSTVHKNTYKPERMFFLYACGVFCVLKYMLAAVYCALWFFVCSWSCLLAYSFVYPNHVFFRLLFCLLFIHFFLTVFFFFCFVYFVMALFTFFHLFVHLFISMYSVIYGFFFPCLFVLFSHHFLHIDFGNVQAYLTVHSVIFLSISILFIHIYTQCFR